MPARNLHISKRQIAMLHVIKNNSHMSDPEYRGILKEAAGVDSSVNLDQKGFGRVLGLMQAKGCTVNRKQSHYPRTHRTGRASPDQLEYVNGLRRQVFGEAGEQAFNRWLEHYFHVSHINFLTPKKAASVIEAMKAMKARKGEAK